MFKKLASNCMRELGEGRG